MAKLTMFFGALLVVVGMAGHLMHGNRLHPVWLGLAIVVCGALAMTEDSRRRMLFMHIAVTLGLVGLLIPGIMSVRAMVKAHAGVWVEQPSAIHEQMVVAVICLVFVALCVRSFIAARRARTV
jgi:hypothetical protein